MELRLFKNMKSVTLGVAMSLFGLSAFGQTVYDVISGSANHTTLTAAIDAAGLNTTLSDPAGDFTVFAPDDAAFTDLLAELGITAGNLLGSPDLSDILTYHVLAGTTNAVAISNGDIVTPLNTANTLKFTVTAASEVFVNQAQVNGADLAASNGVVHSINAALLTDETVADVAIDNGFNTLVAAVVEARLLPALTDPFAELTVFAPTDAAFSNALTDLGISAGDLLASADLANILLYHVLGAEVLSTDISNGQIVTPLNANNTIKATVQTNGDVFVNQAQVTTADVTAENGVVHIIDQVIFEDETVADVAIDNGFTTLVAAVVEARLLPALTDPFSELTVFAPTDAAFTDALTNLGISAGDLLASADLTNILLFHVLGTEVLSGDISNGDLVTPLFAGNTVKMTVKSNGDVFANHAQVTGPDQTADNGTVHIIDKVILANETVVDAAIDNGFTILTQAVVTAELLPALTNPFEEYTVFAPTDAAFTTYITDEGITAGDLLADANLSAILLYHTVGMEVLSGDLANGAVTTLNGDDVIIDLTNGVMVNDANVVTADVQVENGVVHAIDKVLIPGTASIEELTSEQFSVYPNPTSTMIKVDNFENASFKIFSMNGEIVKDGAIESNSIRLESLNNGIYHLHIYEGNKVYTSRFVKQ